jgi:hypothetical protein
MYLNDDEEDQKINFDPLEIAACEWISLDEWANSPEKHPVPITLHLARIAVDVLDGREQLLEPNLIEVKLENSNETSWSVMMYQKRSANKKQ